MIVTARGHEPDTIKNVVKYIILTYFKNNEIIEMIKNLRYFNNYFNTIDTYWTIEDHINYYLNLCDFIGISSTYFKEKFNINNIIASPERDKSIAIEYFVDKISKFGKKYNKNISVGFSDDDSNTIQHVNNFIKNELSLLYPIEYKIFNT
jgi:hypothetical protein